MRRIYCLLAASQIIGAIDCLAGPSTQNSVESAQSAWQQRESIIRSLEISWDREEFDDGVWIDQRESGHPNARPPRAPNSGPQRKDYRYSQQHRVVISGDRISWRIRGQNLRGWQSGELYEIDDQCAFDGDHVTSFGFREESDTFRFPQAVLSRTKQQMIADVNLFPVLFNVCPSDVVLKSVFDLESFTLSSETAAISGYECLCMRQGDRVIWVAPGADYAVLRFSFLHKDMRSVSLEATIEVVKSADGPYLPAKWKTVKQDVGGKVLYSSEARVTDVKVNPDVQPDEFTIQFPKNTLVIDQRAKSGERESIVRQDGSFAPVNGATSYRGALKMVEARDLLERSNPRRLWIGAIASVVAVLSLLLLLRGRVSGRKLAE